MSTLEHQRSLSGLVGRLSIAENSKHLWLGYGACYFRLRRRLVAQYAKSVTYVTFAEFRWGELSAQLQLRVVGQRRVQKDYGARAAGNQVTSARFAARTLEQAR